MEVVGDGVKKYYEASTDEEPKLGTLTIDQILGINYTMVVSGNGGEEQLVIMASPGQSGAWFLHAVATACDGGRIQIEDKDQNVWHFPYGQIKDDAGVMVKVRLIAAAWGLDPLGVDKVAVAFTEHWLEHGDFQPHGGLQEHLERQQPQEIAVEDHPTLDVLRQMQVEVARDANDFEAKARLAALQGLIEVAQKVENAHPGLCYMTAMEVVVDVANMKGVGRP